MATGRPPKAEADRRTNILRVCLTDEERDRLDATASSKGLSSSAFVRIAAMTEPDNQEAEKAARRRYSCLCRVIAKEFGDQTLRSVVHAADDLVQAEIAAGCALEESA